MVVRTELSQTYKWKRLDCYVLATYPCIEITTAYEQTKRAPVHNADETSVRHRSTNLPTEQWRL